MQITRTLNDSNLHADFSGRFTFSDHRQFRDLLDAMEDTSIKDVVFSLQKVEFIDSAGLGMLLLALDRMTRAGRSLILAGATGQTKKIFDLAGFDTLFTLR